LLLAVALAGVGYILTRTLKGSAATAGTSRTSAKGKGAAARPAKPGKGKARRASR
jgi:hypothetical protein